VSWIFCWGEQHRLVIRSTDYLFYSGVQENYWKPHVTRTAIPPLLYRCNIPCYI